MKCYLCGSAMKEFIHKGGYQLWECLDCGLKSTELPEPYEAFARKFYSKGYYTGVSKYSAYADYRKDKWHIVQNMKKLLTKIKAYKPHGKILDVGTAMGHFVELALKKGYDAYGFDVSDYAVEKGKEHLNSRLTEGSIHDVEYPKKSFDVITLFDVIEHVGDPVTDLKKLASFLKDDGIILMATGDTESRAAKYLGRKWTFYIPPQHLFFFTKKNMDTLLEQSGLELIERFGIGKWLSLRYILHLARTSGERKIAHPLYKFVNTFHIGRFPLYLAMQDNQVVVARKKKIHFAPGGLRGISEI